MTRRISPDRLCREVAYLSIELQKGRMNSYDRRRINGCNRTSNAARTVAAKVRESL